MLLASLGLNMGDSFLISCLPSRDCPSSEAALLVDSIQEPVASIVTVDMEMGQQCGHARNS